MRAVLAALERAAERRDVGDMKEHVSERYRDARGRDRQAMSALVAGHFLRNRSVHLLVRVREVQVAAGGLASADVLVAMAGSPIPGPEALVNLRADLFRFRFELQEEEGGYRVIGASWRRATPDDF